MHTAGLTDLQVNGFAGVDFNDPDITADALDHALHAMLLTGVTQCLPTVITASAEALEQRLGALDRAVVSSRLGPLMVPGYHLEGPFLSPLPGYAGCHPAAAMVAPSLGLVTRLGQAIEKPLILVTLAPETEGAIAFVAALHRLGIIAAIGHTAATAAQVGQAAQSGAVMSTHLGNALPQPQPKFANPLMAQLAEDRLAASFIADGIHVPPAALKVMLRAKGAERSVLVTDATAAAAAPPGHYPFAGMVIEHAPDGSVRAPGSTVLAGSALRLDQAVRNLVAWNLATPHEAIGMASSLPRALIARSCAFHGIRVPSSQLEWSETLEITHICVADLIF